MLVGATMAIGVATGVGGGVAAAAVVANSVVAARAAVAPSAVKAASDRRADPALRRTGSVRWVTCMDPCDIEFLSGRDGGVHVGDPGPRTPLTTQTPRAQAAQRGGVGGSVRPGLRPANLGRRL